MTRLGLSRAANQLLRGLIRRAGEEHNRILLSSWTSIDWQSLTFVGERHSIELVVTGPDAKPIAAQLVAGIEDAEFELVGQFVAEICSTAPIGRRADGAALVQLEALTLEA